MKMNNDTDKNLIPKKTKYHVLFRWMLNGGASLNYEKMMSLAYCYSMLPFLKKLHRKEPEELKKSVKNHLQFFNTSPYLAPYIMGINIGIEEKEKNRASNAIMSLKTGLMGPLAGLGDSLFVVIPWTIFGAIAANMALNGSVVGIFIWLLVTWALKASNIPMFLAGLKSGTRLVETIESKLKAITESVAVLGLMVVGALIPAVVKADIAFSFKQGKVNMTGTDILNQIMPGIIPALTVFLVYYMLGKKVKPVWIILLIIVVSILAFVLKILK